MARARGGAGGAACTCCSLVSFPDPLHLRPSASAHRDGLDCKDVQLDGTLGLAGFVLDSLGIHSLGSLEGHPPGHEALQGEFIVAP